MRNFSGADPFAISGSKGFRRYVVRDKNKNRWREADSSLETFPQKGSFNVTSIQFNKTLLMLWISGLMIGLGILGVRSFYLQAFYGERYGSIE